MRISPNRKPSARQAKSVLLVEQPSPDRDRHEKTLTRNGYKPVVAETADQAKALWQPHRFELVVFSLVDGNDFAVSLCNELKETDSEQLIALIFHPDRELPATDCPTIIFTTEPDEYFLARVETLTSASRIA
jgi:PleD family two-component response regulator